VVQAVAAADLAWCPVGPHYVLELWTRNERVWLLHEQHLKKLRAGLAAVKGQLREQQGGAPAAAGVAAEERQGRRKQGVAAAGAAEADSQLQENPNAAADATPPPPPAAAAEGAERGAGSTSQAAAAVDSRADSAAAGTPRQQSQQQQQQQQQEEEEEGTGNGGVTDARQEQVRAVSQALSDPSQTGSDSPGAQLSSKDEDEAEREIEEMPLFGVVVTGTASAGDNQRPRGHQVLASQLPVEEALDVVLAYALHKLGSRHMTTVSSEVGCRGQGGFVLGWERGGGGRA
jgi:hypothetical protein